MENRKLIKFLIPIFILGFFVVNHNSVFAYGTETHAYLTDEIIKFYNQNFSNQQIPKELKDYLIDGSRREDDVPRWMNHFYDPVYNRGLSYDPKIDPLYNLVGTWQKSKDWAQDKSNQNTLTYKVPATIASILTAIEQQKINIISTETDFTWQKAIRFYAQGDKEKAMFVLGHIIHLIEDTSVPDHTRNDPHIGDSPYENYTQKFTLSNPYKNLSSRLINKVPIILTDLNSYFDELANYSNNNFYSKDTVGIQSGYNYPEPDYFQILEDGRSYGIQVDKEFGDYPILMAKGLLGVKTDELLNRPFIMSNYWSRLSTKAIQYSAGVINLFLQEAEAAKNDPNFNKQEEKSLIGQMIDAAKNLFAQAGNYVTSLFGNNQDFHPAGQVSLGNENTNLNEQINQFAPSETEPSQKINQSSKEASATSLKPNKDLEGRVVEPSEVLQDESPQDELKEIIKQENQQEQIETKPQTKIATTTISSQNIHFKECVFSVGQFPSRQKFIINEVAWMGTTNSASDEWIELKNISGSEIDLTNWQLIDKGEQIKINLAFINGSKTIKPGRFILLERTNDSSVSDITADLIYTGALSNSDEGLRLFDGQCNLIDEVLAAPNWPAGSSGTKQTMERKQDFSWQASQNANGTPKADNSPGAVTYSSGGGGSSASVENISRIEYPKILISEIKINPTAERFIELYNPNNSEINLTNWYIQRKTKTASDFGSLVSKNDFEGKIIPANGYFVISRSASSDTDLVISDFTLSASNTLQLKNPNQEVVDKIGWGDISDFEGLGTAPGPENSQSIQRKVQDANFVDTDDNFNDFEIQICPSPKAQSRTCSLTNQTPNAFFVYSPEETLEGAAITFDATSSTDSDGLISLYEWDFGDGSTATTTTSTITYSYSTSGNYLVSLFVFDNEDASSTIVSNSINIGSQANIQNFSVDYNSGTMELELSWQPPTGEGVPSSTLIYRITDISASSTSPISLLPTIETTSTAAKVAINEVDKTYALAIQAFDENDWDSGISRSTVSVPSFVSGLYFYQPASSTDYLIETYYNQYHFVPDLYYGPPNTSWKLLVFYLNSEPEKQLNIDVLPYQPTNLENVLAVKYKHCSGGSITKENSLLLPDVASRCGTEGDAQNIGFAFTELEDNHFMIYAASSSQEFIFNSNDFITVAFYSPSGIGVGPIPHFQLVAVDRTKYYFGQLPTHQSPQLSGQINLNFDRQNSRLNIDWPKATDPDTLDYLLTYEIKYNESDNWQSINSNATGTTKIVAPGDNFLISLRAKDDFDNYSTPTLTANWSYPPTTFYITQIATSSWDENTMTCYGCFGRKDGNSNATVSLQSIIPGENFSFNTVVLKIRRLQANGAADLQLSVYSNNATTSQPDFGNPMETSNIGPILGNPENQDLTFTFSGPISLTSGSKYWLVLEVANYDNNTLWQSNAWQTAFANDNPYSGGETGKITKNFDSTHSGFYINTDLDWYMKIGLE